MIRVTRQIKCLIAQALGVIPHPLPEVNFLMVEIPTLKPYIFMIRVTRQIKCLIAQALGVIPHPHHNIHEKNRESIRDATVELQVKIIWSCFINK
jgi:hypothetical protein